MARKPRIHFPGAVYHVILKGLENQLVFKGAADRRQWESLIGEGTERFGYTLHGFCWARDHIQMAVQVGDMPLAKIMQNLSFRYTRYYNKQHDREGPLFQGRYKAILIDPDKYLGELVRYIHNNPVRSGTARSARTARGTSHQAYLDPDKQPSWLTTSVVLESFDKRVKVARRSFARFVEAGGDEGERIDLMRGLEGGRVLGDSRFIRRALKPARPTPALMTLNQMVKRLCREEGVKEKVLQSPTRARHESRVRQTITYLAMELGIASLSTMADRFNRDLTTMSRNQRYFRERLAEDKALQKHVRMLRRKLLAAA